MDISILARLWQENPTTDFSEAHAVFKTCDAEQCAILSRIALYVYGQNPVSMLQILCRCSDHQSSALKLLARLIALYSIDANRVQMMLESSNLKQELKQLEEELYSKNLDRFHYDLRDVAQKIAQIRKKSLLDEEDDEPLATDVQAQ